MLNTVYNILSELEVPVLFELRPDINATNRVGISYHFFNEGYNQYGDGVGTEFGGALQVDVFAHINYNYQFIVSQIRTLLEDAGFRFYSQSDNADITSNIQYFHKVMIFNYIEREVNNGI